MSSAARKIAVVGGGWAGCAAAVELARNGCTVSLLEAARTLGGRARRVELNGLALDNGQHILLGAYSESLRLMRTVGINTNEAMLRLPLQMRYPAHSDGMHFVVPRLPAPLHLLVALLRASGLAREDKLALARFSSTTRWMEWRLDTDCSVMELLERFDQTERLIRLMWRPLCIAALNTPPERASAQIFLNVLRDSLGSHRAASDMLIPRIDLSALFPQHAAAFIERHRGTVRCGTTVKNIKRDGPGWRLQINEGAGNDEYFDAVVIATQPSQAAALLSGISGAAQLPAFEHAPITTCYLQYAPDIRLQHPLFALRDDAAAGHWGQFVFDRGQLDNRHAGLLSVVISASGEAIKIGHAALADAIAAQLAQVFQQPALAAPKWVRVISEKRATFSCTPALIRPTGCTGYAGLVIAGDYTEGEYPATLEAAVRSGMHAARSLLPPS